MQTANCASHNLEIGKMSFNKNLHLKFVKLGNDRRQLTNELLALLPEIHERKIYKKYAATIIEYAGKFGGLSKGVVLKRLRLEKHLQNKPLLQEAVRAQGVHKVALVAALATPETEKVWADKLKNMSKSALQELSKEVRSRRAEVLTTGDAGLCGGPSDNLGGSSSGGDSGVGLNCGTSFDDPHSAAPCKAVPIKITLELDEESSFLFLSLKKKIGGNLGNKEVMKKILEMANATTVIAKSSTKTASRAEDRHIGSRLPRDNKNTSPRLSPSVKVIPEDNFKADGRSRYIPAHIKRTALANTNGHCSYPACNRPPEVFHHTERFSLNQNHKSITPLCKIHHEFAHNGLILNEKHHSKNWQMQFAVEEPNRPEEKTDHLYKWRRQFAIAKQQ